MTVLAEILALLRTWLTAIWSFLDPVLSINTAGGRILAIATLMVAGVIMWLWKRRAPREASEAVGIRALGPRPSIREICDYLSSVIRKHVSVVATGAFAVEELSSIRRDLDDGTLRLYLLGHQNAGKSSLANALLGQTLSPVGMGKSTTALVRIGTDAKRRAVVRWQNGVEEPINLRDIRRLMNAWADADDRPAEIVLFVDRPILGLRNLELVDCPGSGSIVHDDNTASVEDRLVAQAIRSSAVAILVYRYTVSEMEAHDHLLRQLGESGVPIVAVCNLTPDWASDYRVNRREIEETISKAEKRLRTVARARCFRIAVESRPEVTAAAAEAHSATLDELTTTLRDMLSERKSFVLRQATRRCLGVAEQVLSEARARIAVNSRTYTRIAHELEQIDGALRVVKAALRPEYVQDRSGAAVGATVGTGLGLVGGLAAAVTAATTVVVTGGAVVALAAIAGGAGATIGWVRDWRKHRAYSRAVAQAFAILREACERSTLINASLQRQLRSTDPSFFVLHGHTLVTEVQVSINSTLAQIPEYATVNACRELERELVSVTAALSEVMEAAA